MNIIWVLGRLESHTKPLNVVLGDPNPNQRDGKLEKDLHRRVQVSPELFQAKMLEP